ncbi:MAG: cysteine hydrolase [Sedimentisphaerales bacterium]|nr:cysteine hydrolase [Sedimentisphaerales bacterium]
MIMQLHKHQRKHILLDIDTQRDFLSEWGNACILNREKVLANIRRVMAWARFKNISVISTAEVFPNNNGHSMFGYCLDGTSGQQKIRYTLLNNRVSFPADDWNALPADLLLSHRQIILHKRCINPFEEPRIERLLSEIKADEFILIGTCTEDAVEATALGLLHRGKKVRVIVDAVGSHTQKEAKIALRKMETKGAKLIQTKDIAGVSRLKYTHICGCGRRWRRLKRKVAAIGTGRYKPILKENLEIIQSCITA